MINYDKTHTFSYRVPIIIAIIIIGTLKINAQNQVTGTVSNRNQPIPYASVTINADSASSSTIKGYAITNDEGKFSIKADFQINDWLIVQCLGYKELKRQITSTSGIFNLQMEEDVVSLSEITVKANYSGIKFSNDTVSLDTKHYAIGTEENIGEVLKKIPGIEVNETGKVSYAGRNIGKILIDGKDIISSSSNLAINNLSADLMESAEVLTNYKNNSLTDAFKKDETLALNIKTSGKQNYDGYVECSGGYKNKFQTKSNLLHIGEKGSFSAILSANNVGNAVFSIEDYISNIVGIDNLLSQNKTTYSLSNEESKMLLPPDNVYRNTNGALSINTTYKPSENFNFKGNVIYNGSFIEASNYSEDLYFSGNVANKKDERNEDVNHYITANFQEIWKIKENLEINVSTRFNLGKYDAEQSLSNNISNKSFLADNNNDLLSTQFIQELSTNYILGNGLLYSYIRVDASNRDNSYRILSDSLLLPIDYLPTYEEEYPYIFVANTITRKLSVSPEVGYVFPLFKNVNLNASLSYDYFRNKLIYLDDRSIYEFSKWDKFQTNIRLEKNKGFFRFGLGVELSLNSYMGNVFDKRDTKGFVSPELSASLIFSPKHRLNLSFIYDTKPTEIEFLAKNSRVAGYNEMLNGSSLTKWFNNEANISLNYSIFDLFTNTTFFLFASYIDKHNLPKSCISQNNIISSTTYQDGGKQRVCMMKSYLNKGLSFIPVDAKLTCSYALTEYNILLKESDNNVKSQNIVTGLNFSSRFKSAFNVELGVNYHYNTTTTSNTSIENDIHEWTATSKFHYSYKNIKAYIYGNFVNINNPFYEQDNIDVGFGFEYKINKIGIKLSGNNLLHLNNMEWIGIYNTSYYTSTSLYKKIPGYLLCSLSYRF